MTTEPITILPADVPYEDTLDNGCLLTDSDIRYLATHMRPPMTKAVIEQDKLNPVALMDFNTNPVTALRKFDFDTTLLEAASAYVCPILQQQFRSVVPLYLVTNDIKKYSPVKSLREDRIKMLDDTSWNMHWFDENVKTGRFVDCMLGPGYTSGFLPTDGFSDFVMASFKLSNGDYLLAKTFTWFNK